MKTLSKNIWRKTLLPAAAAGILLFPLLTASRVFSEPQDPSLSAVLTFKDFYQKVLAYYPKLKQQDANVNLALARKMQAAAGFLPSAQIGAGVSHGDDPVYVFGALLRENNFASDNFALSKLNTPSPHTTYNLTLSGQIPIFDAMQTISRVRSAKLHVDSAQYEAALTQMEAFLVASEAYLKAVAIEKLLNTAADVSRASEEDVKQAEDLKEKGLILGADFYTAKVSLGNINQFKNELAREKQAAHVLLNVLMGEDPFKEFEIRSEEEQTNPDGQTLQHWFEAAFQFRPDLAAIDKVIQAQGIEVSREKSTRLPRVDAFGEARQDTPNFSSDGGQNFIVGVKAKMDLFDPSYSSRVRTSRETLKKLEYDKAMLKDSIARDLANEFARNQTARDNLPLMRKMLEDAKQAVDLTMPLYREGRKSIADLLAIRWAYLQTAQGFYSLATDSKASWTRLLFLSGQLNESNIKDVVENTGE